MMKLKQFNYYKREIKKADEGNKDKLRTIINAKRIFCIPWLLVSDVLFINYPNQYKIE